MTKNSTLLETDSTHTKRTKRNVDNIHHTKNLLKISKCYGFILQLMSTRKTNE